VIAAIAGLRTEFTPSFLDFACFDSELLPAKQARSFFLLRGGSARAGRGAEQAFPLLEAARCDPVVASTVVAAAID
jgi:hypothetical protein